MPVLVNAAAPFPGAPLAPWPAAERGVPYNPPTGRGRQRITEDLHIATWLPVLPDLTPHGLRHGHQTWMDEAGVSYVLQSDRMGHEVPGMRGVYSHISPTMRTHLSTTLQKLWIMSLAARAALTPRSSVPILDRMLAPYRVIGRSRLWPQICP